MSWWEWVFTVVYLISLLVIYLMAKNNEITFYEDYLDVFICACGTVFGVLFVDTLQSSLRKSPSSFDYGFMLVCLLASMLLLVATLLNTKNSNGHLKLFAVVIIFCHKIILAPMVAVGVLKASSMVMGKNSSLEQRAGGLISLAIIFWFFDVLVNGEAVKEENARKSADSA